MLVMFVDNVADELVVSMGGIVDGQQDYVAVGMGMDTVDLVATDVAACYRQGRDSYYSVV